MASGYKQVRVEEAPLPGAVYACSNGVCALEVSYPAELLCWFDGLPAAEDDDREGPWPPDETANERTDIVATAGLVYS